jgi:phospholipid transport system substrate-binding protein
MRSTTPLRDGHRSSESPAQRSPRRLSDSNTREHGLTANTAGGVHARRSGKSLLRLAGASFGFVLTLAMASAGAANDPSTQVKAAVDRVLQIIQDPALKGEAKAAQRQAALMKTAEEIFDFSEIARRAMGTHWRSLTEPQRAEFTQLFAELLERSYIGKIEQYKGEPIRYTGAQIQQDLATVSTRIVTKNGTEVPIDYRMFPRGDRWFIYDVSIEGVSLVNNYRTQFNSIMQTSSYAELVRKINSRLAELRKGP